MGYNDRVKSYWNDKENMSRKAKQHVIEMDDDFEEEIKECVDNSRIYLEDFKGEKIREGVEQSVEFLNTGTVEAIFEEDYDGKVAVLNFASFKYAGGGFLSGSIAQEECLCHSSYLYNVLVNFESDYYSMNRRSLNRALYSNRAIYTEGVRFFDDVGDSKVVDVITCAAPNKRAAMKYNSVPTEENGVYLRERIKFILNIAEKENVDVLILGAFGCGVFAQKPEEVALYFLENLDRRKRFKRVIFAVPGKDVNTIVFKNAIEKYNSKE